LLVDFFCGMGGLSLGFVRANEASRSQFEILGFDHDPYAAASYVANLTPTRSPADAVWDARLGYPDFARRPSVVMGGPPCRPWSPINLQRRGPDHRDFHLLADFAAAIDGYDPEVFVVENVPAVKRDLDAGLKRLEVKYSVRGRVISYADWGAPTRRRRYFVVGVRRGQADELWQRLDDLKRTPTTVAEAIGRYRALPAGAAPDHEWAEYRTIHKYAAKYETGQYGWYRLDWDAPSPSFGNIAKTYTLHPDAEPPRVLSVREAAAIMGFDDRYAFPPGIPRTAKYRMASDSVSPKFSEQLAIAVADHLRVTNAEPQAIAS
jgi:DNA (cytosine-5)-methyltransferase 1